MIIDPGEALRLALEIAGAVSIWYSRRAAKASKDTKKAVEANAEKNSTQGLTVEQKVAALKDNQDSLHAQQMNAIRELSSAVDRIMPGGRHK